MYGKMKEHLSAELKAIEEAGLYKQERIITSPYKADRSTSEGIIEAITEMYALKSTQKIYGSYRSSYSILAADLSNIPLII